MLYLPIFIYLAVFITFIVVIIIETFFPGDYSISFESHVKRIISKISHLKFIRPDVSLLIIIFCIGALGLFGLFFYSFLSILINQGGKISGAFLGITLFMLIVIAFVFFVFIRAGFVRFNKDEETFEQEV